MSLASVYVVIFFLRQTPFSNVIYGFYHEFIGVKSKAY